LYIKEVNKFLYSQKIRKKGYLLLKFIELHYVSFYCFVTPHSLWSMNPLSTEDVHAELGPPYSTVTLLYPSSKSVCLEYLGRRTFAIKATYVMMNPSEEWRIVKKDGGRCHPFHTVGHPGRKNAINSGQCSSPLIDSCFHSSHVNHVSVRLWYMWDIFFGRKVTALSVISFAIITNHSRFAVNDIVSRDAVISLTSAWNRSAFLGYVS